MQQVQRDRTAGVVEDRHRVDPAGPHQLECVGAALAGRTATNELIERRFDGASRVAPRSNARRRSPSVTTPTKRPSCSTASAMPPAPVSSAMHRVSDRRRARDATRPAVSQSNRGTARARRDAEDDGVVGDVCDDHGAHTHDGPSPSVMWSRTAAPEPDRGVLADVGARRR